MPFPLALAPAVGFLKRIPRGVWIAVLIAALLGLGTCAHKRSVKRFGEERFAAGVKAEGDRIAAKAEALKRKADALSRKISNALKEKNDEENRAIASNADALRLSGAGKAACPRSAGVPSAPGRSEPANGRSDVAGPEMPSGDFAAVPWGWLVDSAERCDLNRAEVLTWREWHRQQSEAWANIK